MSIYDPRRPQGATATRQNKSQACVMLNGEPCI